MKKKNSGAGRMPDILWLFYIFSMNEKRGNKEARIENKIK